MPRIVGIDLARALAIGGMFVAHLALKSDDGYWWIADGRPSALFALLAGCGLGFMTARIYPDVRAEVPRVLLRAFYLGVLGIALMFLNTPVAIILSSYAVMFALTVPFLAMAPARLFAWAGAVLVVAPPIVQGARILVTGEPSPSMWVPGLSELLTGYYPALAWLAYSLVGLAVVRLPIATWRTQLGLLGGGIIAAVAGYGIGHMLTPVAARTGSAYLLSLVAIEPHTDSAFEMLGNIGVCLIVIALSLIITRLAAVRWALAPVLAAGSMSLTLYVGHLLYIWALGPDAVWNVQSQVPLLLLIIVSLVFALGWSRFFTKGPLEWALAELVRRSRLAPDRVS